MRRSCPRDARIRIHYFAIPNANTSRGGFLPMIAVNGRWRGDTYGRGMPAQDAAAQARVRAQEEAERYIGDWCVTLKKGRPRSSR